MKSRRSWWRAMLRTPLGALAAGLVAAFVVLAVVAPIAFHHGADTDNVVAALEGSSAAHPLGTDALGRDILDRVLVATRLSLEMAVAATALGTAGGLVLGALPAVLGRRAGRLVVALINLTVAFPNLLLALFLSIVFGLGTKGALLAISVATVPGIARLTQTLTSSVAGADYMAAARLLAVRRSRVIARHVLPNIAEPLVINVTLSLGSTLLAFAALSFLGLGVQPPAYDWGELLSQGLGGIYSNPAAAVAPGVAVVVAGMAFNLLGDAVARALGAPGARYRTRQPLAPVASPTERVAADDPVLAVEGLRVAFPGPAGWVTPVADVSFELQPGEVLGIVGESGSGKSLTAMAIGRLVGHPGVVSAGRMTFAGRDLSTMSDAAVSSLFGTSLSMVFQDPLSALNPALRVGPQLAEVAQIHEGHTRRAALARAVDRLGAVRLPNPRRRAKQYPHELSGGMRQRAVIGMGLMVSPKLVIADEPTTALDVTVQRQVLDLLGEVRRDLGAAIVLISHDIAVVGQVCQRVLVMYAGRIVEDLPVGALQDAAHPYTRALVATVPDMSTDRGRPLPTIPGRPPDPADLPPGCAFSPRCPFVTEQCRSERPPLTDLAGGRRVACWHPQRTSAPTSSVGAGTVGS